MPILPMMPAVMPVIIAIIVIMAIVVGSIVIWAIVIGGSRVVIISRIVIATVIPRSATKRDTEALRLRIVLAHAQQA